MLHLLEPLRIGIDFALLSVSRLELRPVVEMILIELTLLMKRIPKEEEKVLKGEDFAQNMIHILYPWCNSRKSNKQLAGMDS